MLTGRRKVFFVLVGICFIAGIFGFLVVNNFGRQEMASLVVNSSPSLEVFVDGKKVGMTPYSGTYAAKRTTVQVGNYQAEVFLQPKIKTIINRNFTEGLSISFGELLSFEKTGLSKPSVAVISEPGAEIYLNGGAYGKTPVVIDNLNEGSYLMKAVAEGFKERELKINVVNGFKLIAAIDLVPTEPVGVQETTLVESVEKVVEILATPNNFLRVRSGPTTSSSELGRVRPGEKYTLVEIDEKSGWFNIQLSATQSGWISNVYAAVHDPDNETNPD